MENSWRTQEVEDVEKMRSLFPQIRPKAIKTITIINKYKLNMSKKTNKWA